MSLLRHCLFTIIVLSLIVPNMLAGTQSIQANKKLAIAAIEKKLQNQKLPKPVREQLQHRLDQLNGTAVSVKKISTQSSSISAKVVKTQSVSSSRRRSPMGILTSSYIDYINPSASALNCAPSCSTIVTFYKNLDTSTVSDSTVRVYGSISGRHTGSLAKDDVGIYFVPATPYASGEVVSVTLTDSIRFTDGDTLKNGFHFSYVVATKNAGSGTFIADTSISANGWPYFNTLADFNNDGYPDIAVADNYSSVVVYLNDGSGKFGAAASYATSEAYPWAIASADFNNDGYMDIVTTTWGSSYDLNVFINKGDGTFNSVASYSFGGGACDIATADLNGDGFVDIIATDAYGDKISVFINNGDGTFASEVEYSVGSYPYFVAAADFNNDGAVDLAVTNGGVSDVSILLNNGDGTFTVSPTTYETGNWPNGIASADFNGDGYADLAVANEDESSVSIMLGNGDGTFVSKTDYAAYDWPIAIKAADLNADGKMDLIATNDDGTITVLTGVGDGTFTSSTKTVLTASSPCSYGLSVADCNNDGILDLAVVDCNNYTINVLQGLAPASEPTVQASGLTSTAATAHTATLKWINGDGANRIVLATEGSSITDVPADGSAYTADAIYANGSGIGNSYVVYNGSDTAVTVRGLTANTTYTFTVFEYNGSSVVSNYLTVSPATASAATSAQTAPDGTAGTALRFDGTNDYVQVSPGVWFNGDFTVEAWVYVRSYSHSNRLFDFGNGEGYSNVLLALSQDFDGRVVLTVYDSTGSGGYVSSPDPMPLNQWVHLAVTMSGNTATFYKDGTVWTSGILGYVPENIRRKNNYIAKSDWSADSLSNMNLDEFRIWNTARTESEITADKDTIFTSIPVGLIGYWQFNEASGDLAFDAASGTAAVLKNFDYTSTSGWVASTACSPLAVISAAIPDTTHAVLNGVVNPWKASTTVKFLYGNTPGAYTDSVTVSGGTIDGDALCSVSAGISGLTKGTIYYCRVSGTSTSPAHYFVSEEGRFITNTIVCDSLVAWYPFVGNADDESGHGYSATSNNATLTTDRFVSENKAYVFESDKSITLPHIPFDSRSFSISAWIYRTSSGNMAILQQEESEDLDKLLHCVIRGDSVEFNFYGDDLGGHTKLDQDQWYHVVFVYDVSTNTKKIYVNDALDGSAVATNSFQGTSGTTQIGYYAGDSDWFTGKLDDFRFYHKALNEEEIQLLYNESAVSGIVTGISPVKTETPKIFALNQNYPNPFNPSTTVSFTLAKDGFTTLKIYDMLGREVATLVNGDRKAGVVNAVTFNASKLSSGVYFSRLVSSSNVQVKKLMLLK
jgi:hypothetical protein